MTDPTKSPAVQSLNAERARERANETDRLEPGLEDTFPASDPVSVTQSSVASTIDTTSTNDEEEFSLVEEALRSTGENVDDRGLGIASSLRRDASRLSGQASEVASGAVAVGKAEVKSAIQGIEDLIRDRPLTAVGIVAAFAWLFGATR